MPRPSRNAFRFPPLLDAPGAPRPRSLTGGALLLLALLLGGGAALWPPGAPAALAASPNPFGTDGSAAYFDAKLRFSLQLPGSWHGEAHPGTQFMARATDVTLVDGGDPASQIDLSVQQGADPAHAFVARGTPTAKVGRYPAFVDDVPGDADQGRGDCLVRSFLAATDYVIAQWCGADAAAHRQRFEDILATYVPAAAAARDQQAQGFISGWSNRAGAYAISQPASCADLVARAQYKPTDLSNWGRELAGPDDPRWSPYPRPAVSVCSNFYFVDGRPVSYPRYTFQCTELANRFLREQWGHGAIDGNAETYYDYYDGAGKDGGGKPHRGTARIFPDAAFSDDATQGTSAFMPSPGDLIVFQDVNDGARWTSGLRPGSPGHVAVITGTDAGHVYMMQQNFSDALASMALPMTATPAGWHIADTISGVKGRIVRGWIHFAANGGAAARSAAAPVADTRAAYAIGGDGELYSYRWQDGGAWGQALDVRAAIAPAAPAAPAFVRLTGTPSGNGYQLAGAARQSVFVVGGDGHLYEYWWRRLDGWHRDDITAASQSSLPTGVGLVGSPSALTYTAPGDNRTRHAVFALGGDGHLYLYSWVLDGGWSGPTDVGAEASGVGVALGGTPDAIAWAEGDAQYLAAYATSNDGRLYEFRARADDATWAASDLTALASAALPAGVTFTGAPGAYAYAPPGETTRRIAVYAIGGDGHLYDFTRAPGAGDGAWGALDVSKAAADGPSGVRLANAPSARAFAQGGGIVHDVFATGADGRLYEYYFVNGGWHGLDVSGQVQGASPPAIAGSPAADVYLLAGDKPGAAPRRGVYAVTADGRLVEFTYDRSKTAWGLADHGAPPGTTLAGGSPDGNAFAR